MASACVLSGPTKTHNKRLGTKWYSVSPNPLHTLEGNVVTVVRDVVVVVVDDDVVVVVVVDDVVVDVLVVDDVVVPNLHGDQTPFTLLTSPARTPEGRTVPLQSAGQSDNRINVADESAMMVQFCPSGFSTAPNSAQNAGSRVPSQSHASLCVVLVVLVVLVVDVTVVVVVVVDTVDVVPGGTTTGAAVVATVGGPLGGVLVGATDRQLGALQRFGQAARKKPHKELDDATRLAQYGASICPASALPPGQARVG